MRVVITRDEKRDGQLLQSSSESEAGTVDGESHGTAEAGDRDRGWKSSGRRKRTEAKGKHGDWRGRGEKRGGGNVGGDIRVEIDTTADEISAPNAESNKVLHLMSWKRVGQMREADWGE
jgi:hypothetical protein